GARSAPRRAATDGAHQEPGNRVEQQGDAKQNQGQRREGTGVHRAGRLRELVGNHRWQGVTGGEQRGVDLRGIADHHGDRHRLAQGATQSEDDRSYDPGAAVGQGSGPNHLPLGGTQRQRAFLQRDRHLLEHFNRYRGDGWQNHYRQNQPAREVAQAQRG